jgi:hypothetical protein
MQLYDSECCPYTLSSLQCLMRSAGRPLGLDGKAKTADTGLCLPLRRIARLEAENRELRASLDEKEQRCEELQVTSSCDPQRFDSGALQSLPHTRI